MTKRLFVALDLPSDVKEYLVRIQKDFEATHYFNGKFVAPDHMHQTLSFIGNVNEKMIPHMSVLLQAIKFMSFKVSLGHLGVFPNSDFISIVWIDLKSDKIAKLSHEINYALRDLIKKEEREFVSHITLARVKSVASKEELLKFIDGYKIDHYEFNISEFVLKESELRSKGSVHTTIERFPLIS